MVDIRKIIIIFVVAVLFSILVFAVIGAVYPEPKYEDFCKNRGPPPIGKINTPICPDIPIPQEQQDVCLEKKGEIQYTNYDTNGCPRSFECNTCNNDFKKEEDKYNQYKFYISAVLALLAIFLGMFLPYQANTLNEWIGTGFMLGGTFALFFGTAITYTSLGRYVKPIVIFLELALVILIAYRQVGKLREDKKKLRKK